MYLAEAVNQVTVVEGLRGIRTFSTARLVQTQVHVYMPLTSLPGYFVSNRLSSYFPTKAPATGSNSPVISPVPRLRVYTPTQVAMLVLQVFVTATSFVAEEDLCRLYSPALPFYTNPHNTVTLKLSCAPDHGNYTHKVLPSASRRVLES